MGFRQGYIRDFYHVGNHSKATPRLAYVFFYFFLFVVLHVHATISLVNAGWAI